jgi:hypothetical protein
MLPQFGPLEGTTADEPRVGTKRVLLKCRSAFRRKDEPQGARDQARKGLFGGPKLAVFVLDKRIARAKVPRGAGAGIHIGRVVVRAGGSFKPGNADGVSAKYCKLLHRADRYGYGWQLALSCRD